jgi:hypothetical protein
MCPAFLALLVLAADIDPEPPSFFDSLTRERIKKRVESDGFIPGNGHTLQLSKGTIVLYRTNEKRYGKLMILDLGKNLIVKWVTYDSEGNVTAKGDRHVIRSSWQLDLDLGGDGGRGKSLPDCWWQPLNQTDHQLVSENNALFLIDRVKK